MNDFDFEVCRCGPGLEDELVTLERLLSRLILEEKLPVRAAVNVIAEKPWKEGFEGDGLDYFRGRKSTPEMAVGSFVHPTFPRNRILTIGEMLMHENYKSEGVRFAKQLAFRKCEAYKFYLLNDDRVIDAKDRKSKALNEYYRLISKSIKSTPASDQAGRLFGVSGRAIRNWAKERSDALEEAKPRGVWRCS